MKLTLTSLLVAMFMLPALSGTAQSQPKHELSVSYGIAPVNEFSSIGIALISFGTITSDVKSTLGAFNLSYVYKLNKVVALGASYTYSGYTDELFLLKQSMGTAKNTFHSILPTAKFNWLNTNFVTLYSKVALGIVIGTVKPNYTDENNRPQTASHTGVYFGYQATPFGIEVGRKFAIFAEAGIGEMGTLALGARLRF